MNWLERVISASTVTLKWLYCCHFVYVLLKVTLLCHHCCINMCWWSHSCPPFLNYFSTFPLSAFVLCFLAVFLSSFCKDYVFQLSTSFYYSMCMSVISFYSSFLCFCVFFFGLMFLCFRCSKCLVCGSHFIVVFCIPLQASSFHYHYCFSCLSFFLLLLISCLSATLTVLNQIS